jgi:hypothetical protein
MLIDLVVFFIWIVCCSAFAGIVAYAVGFAIGEALGGPDFWNPPPAPRPSNRPFSYELLKENLR